MKITSDKKLPQILSDIDRALNSSRRVLVVAHVDPDGDALGTQLAFGRYLKHIDKPYTLVRDSEIPDKYSFLPDIDSIVTVRKMPAPEFDTVLVLECPSAERTGRVAPYLDRAEQIINIDHHPSNRIEGTVDWIDTGRSSVGEMAYDFFESVGFAIDAPTATQLYTAILTDTGRFRFESTTPHSLSVAGRLVEAGANPREICDRVYFDQDPSLIALTGQVLNTVEFHNKGRICLLTLTKEMLKKSGANLANTEGLVDFTLYTRGVQVGALLREIDSRQTKISLRSRNGCDISVLAMQFDGGGHPNAAGCRVALSLEKAKNEILERLKERDDCR